MSPSRLQFLRIFRSMLGASALAGCGDPLRDSFDEALCQDGEVPLVRGLKPAQPVDYVALRTAFIGNESVPTVEQADGVCANEPACAADAEPPAELYANRQDLYESGQGLNPNPYTPALDFLTIARGDEVKHLWTLSEVQAFLGTIDTPSEAALLAYLKSYDLDCEGPNLAFPDDAEGFLLYAETGHTCGANIEGHRLLVTPEGELEELTTQVVEHGNPNCVVGRLPAGLQRATARHRPRRAHPVGAYLSEVSGLEAAAVVAFEDLSRELRWHAAPAGLQRRAARAARQETRHALLTGVLARRYGHDRQVPRVQRTPPRPLVDIAIDNAIEGLTRETFGALLACHQALHARDAAVRRVLQTIAADETEHATLSWDLHRWLSSRLSAAERSRVRSARKAAVARFRRAAQVEADASVRERVGMPSARRSLQLYDDLMAQLPRV